MASHPAPPKPVPPSAAPPSAIVDRLTGRFPVLTAAAVYSLVIAIVFAPFFAGRFLINPSSDQRTGYAFREFAAQYFRAYGDVPQWSPYLYGGMPFAANTAHGDMFYPTFLLRLVLPVDVGMSTRIRGSDVVPQNALRSALPHWAGCGSLADRAGDCAMRPGGSRHTAR